MTQARAERELAALRNAALEELLQISDAELLEDAAAEGLNVSEIAQGIRSCMRSASAGFMRQHLLSAKLVVEKRTPRVALPQLPIARLKELVQRAFQSDPQLGLAFRSGKTQTDEDWVSLYEDLVALGAIRTDESV